MRPMALARAAGAEEAEGEEEGEVRQAEEDGVPAEGR